MQRSWCIVYRYTRRCPLRCSLNFYYYLQPCSTWTNGFNYFCRMDTSSQSIPHWLTEPMRAQYPCHMIYKNCQSEDSSHITLHESGTWIWYSSSMFVYISTEAPLNTAPQHLHILCILCVIWIFCWFYCTLWNHTFHLPPREAGDKNA